MCDNYWEPLAEIYIWNKKSADPDAYIYCLCSRLYIRYPEIYTVLPSEDVNEGEDINGDYVEETQDLHKASAIETQSIEKHDEEPVSCYCSASHTDNNYSTDEHDSVRDSAHWPTAHSLTQKLGLHQSDSGADLSEYYDQHEAKSIQNLVASYGKTFQAAETRAENEYENVDVLTEYNQASGDEESIPEGLTNSITFSNREALGNSKDLVSQYDCDPYNYPYSVYYESNKSAMDIAWEKFWAKNGEKLIWASWIEKYADYINPDYFQNDARTAKDEKSQDAEINEVATEKYFERNTRFASETCENLRCELVHSNFAGFFDQSNSMANDGELKPAPISSLNTNFSFEDTNRQEINDKEADENRKKIVNLEISPEDGNGWNPLSPFSTEENYEQPSNAEDERLLTRCDSINGSVAKTNATSDSMTNVTKMTLTSSSCDSNSVHSSNLMTSVTSSIESSITSSSSDQENEFLMEDNDKYWQHLWRENFQMQYQKHYELFVANYKRENNMDYEHSYLSLNESETGEDSVLTEQDKIAPLHDDVNSEELSEPDSLGIDVPKMRRNKSVEPAPSGNKNTKKNNTCYSKSNKSRVQRLIVDSVGMLIKNLQITEKTDDTEQCLNEAPVDTISWTDYKKSSTDEGIFSSGDSLESVKDGLSIMGYSCEKDNEQDLQGEIIYRKRNLKRQAADLEKYRRSKRACCVSDLDGIQEKCSEKGQTFTPLHRVIYVDQSDVDVQQFPNVQSNAKNSYGQDTSSSDDENCKGIIKETQKKKKRKSFKKYKEHSYPKEIEENKNLIKYYNKRYFLFSRYNEGIQLDSESWFSVTPEKIARHIAEVCSCNTIIDAFCGAGGNAIQFAFTCKRVIAIDIDPNKIRMARHNAEIYGVEDKIEFIIGDFFALAPSLRGDVVFLSPPWGGPDYIKQKVFNLDTILPPQGGKMLFHMARQITNNVAYYLPRNTDMLQLIRLVEDVGHLEITQYKLDGKLKSCTLYCGDLATSPCNSWRQKSDNWKRIINDSMDRTSRVFH
ncbi:trimethylguanosine synthase isoform X1 [Ooceraea biroi]|uniref:trimethylguanosine synthase isoform X1 n=1 Tax=Ooceraea biroi TaxID=2015173 RepID=UPI0005BD1955|nr:trimethylguanosine synthase isoform X1 [Ooceraea biroi]